MASITNMSPALREHMASVGCAPVGPDGLGVLNPIPESSSALGSGLNGIMLGASIGQAIGGIYSAFVGAKTSAYVQKKQAEGRSDYSKGWATQRSAKGALCRQRSCAWRRQCG